MKFTEGGFRDWGYDLAKSEFGAKDLDGGPWQVDREGRPQARSLRTLSLMRSSSRSFFVRMNIQ